ncbi:S-layer homology domain-containing protein [Dialister succinatiphilus]|uniref:S-layer homology domain-containing protein n=1 Tax=Dialister succinatiphilus TaxID=487173 RepID=UPI0040275A78
MKKILAIAAAAALTAGVSAFAANPFSDVSTDDWAYQAVSDLSDQGVVEGYPDGTFKGERNITRYELAQIIARLMAKEDQLNAEQRATLDKLAGEYADELANLGVRVSNLEKKVGNLYWSGDARMRYQDKTLDKADSWNGRIRINVRGQVNDSTYVQGRFLNEMNFKDSASSDTSMDQLYVNHNFGKDFSVRLGRQPISFGDQAGWLSNGHDGYDGAQAAYNNGKLSLTTGYGQFNSQYGDFAEPHYKVVKDKAAIADDNDADFYFARGAYDFDFAKLGVDYIAYQDKHGASYINGDGDTTPNKVDFKGTKPELFGVNLNIPVQQFNVFGEYWKNTTAPSALEDTAWNAGLSYGAANWKKPGTWDLSVAYNNVGNAVYFGDSGWQTNILDAVYAAGKLKFWNAMGDVTLAKNVQLHAEYAFAADADKGEDPDDAWTVSLNYKF